MCSFSLHRHPEGSAKAEGGVFFVSRSFQRFALQACKNLTERPAATKNTALKQGAWQKHANCQNMLVIADEMDQNHFNVLITKPGQL